VRSDGSRNGLKTAQFNAFFALRFQRDVSASVISPFRNAPLSKRFHGQTHAQPAAPAAAWHLAKYRYTLPHPARGEAITTLT